MKKLFSVLIIVVFAFVLSACGGRQRLYILNWAQYMSSDVIRAFEKEFNVRVILDDTAESNEIMYTRIKNNTQPYDIVIPSDYMIHRLYQEELLVELDFDLLPNYQEDMFDEHLNEIRDSYFEGNKNVAIPYFWGTLGIMYNNTPAIKEAVEANSWSVFFEQDKLPANARVGMYLSARDAVAAAQLYLGYSVNSTSEGVLNEAETALKNFSYNRWGTDELKEYVAEGNLDVALVYSGDFFDVLFNYLENDKEITFDMYVPQDSNNIWFDGMVIPTTSQNVELAHEFINFMLDEENALENAFAIGYCPTITSVYLAIIEDEEMEEVALHPGYYPGFVVGEVYEYLGETIYNRMSQILTNARA